MTDNASALNPGSAETTVTKQESAKILNTTKRTRLVIVASHPIQYQAPLFRVLATIPGIDLEVLFLSRHGVDRYRDVGFGVEFSWDIPLLDGYRYRFVNGPGIPKQEKRTSHTNRGLVGTILFGNYDVVWVHGWASLAAWLAWGVAVVRRRPVLMRAESNGLRNSKGPLNSVKKLMRSIFLRRVSAFLCIGSCNRAFYQNHGVHVSKLFSVPYAVDNDSFIQAAGRWRTERDRLRESCGIRNEDVVFLFSGKLITKKRPLDLLQAYETVRSAKRCSLIVVGDGDLRPLMEARIRERRIPDVFLMGFRNQNEIAKFYSIADVLVLPSDSEPWGLVVNEAMCCGLAIVVSDQVGSAYDLVREGQNGYVFPCGDADALAERLQRLLADHEHLRKMQRASRLAIDGWGFEQDVAGVEAALRFVGGAGA